jgi:hypothetical protein
MNRGQLRALARKKLGETTAAFWTDDEINGYINDACREITYLTKCLRANAYISTSSCTTNTTASGASETTLTAIDPDIYSILEVYYNSQGSSWEKLEPKTRTEMDIEFPGWRNATGGVYVSGATTYYNWRSSTGCPFVYYWDREENLFGWYPPTGDDEVTNNPSNVRVYFTKRHADLSGDLSTPQIPDTIHLAIIDFVVATGCETRSIIDRANDYWNKFNERLKTYMTERNREREDDDLVMKGYKNI